MRFPAAARALFASMFLASLVVAGSGTKASKNKEKVTATAKAAPSGSADSPGDSDAPAASSSGAPAAPSSSAAPASSASASASAAAPSGPAPGGAAGAAAAPATSASPIPPAGTSAVATTSAPQGTSSGAKATQSDAALDGATYAVRLRDLESKVDELKEQIRRSHTRLSLLSDTILGGGVGGARAEIRFRNEMSSAFRLTRALFVLDGAVQYNRQDDTGALAAQTEIPIFTGSIPPGDHTLQVLIQLRGHGYGVFSYLRGYKFEVKSSHAFTVTEGKTMELEVTAWEKGGVTTPLEQRPAVRYLEKIRNGTGGEGGTRTPEGGGGDNAGISGSFSVDTGKK